MTLINKFWIYKFYGYQEDVEEKSEVGKPNLKNKMTGISGTIRNMLYGILIIKNGYNEPK